MKAVTWHGERDVRVEQVPDPTIQEPTEPHRLPRLSDVLPTFDK